MIYELIILLYGYNDFLKNLCEDIKNIGKDQETRLHLRRSQITGDIEMKCIFQRMEEFFLASRIFNYNAIAYPYIIYVNNHIV